MGDNGGKSALPRAKITRPIYDNVLPRKKLFEHLDLIRKAPVVWVSGPAGAGKTTLVSSFLDHRALPHLWYQIDEGDADVPTFFHCLGDAVRLAKPRRHKPMPVLTPEYLMGGVPAFSRRFFIEAFDRLKAPAVVVFDNYQEIPLDSPLHDAIREGLAHVPEQVTIIFISRTRPPAPFARLKANGLMGSLGWEELQLTQSEAEGIGELRGAEPGAARALNEKAHGWAAGLVLLLEGEHRRDLRYGTSPRHPSRVEEVFDYFAGEVFRKTDDETQAFLMKTSFLPQMTADMAAAVAETDRSEWILADLSRRNFFTMRKESIGTFQYHPLFRDFLEDRARRSLRPEELDEVHRRSAAALAEQGWFEEAAHLFLKTGQWEELAGLIMKEAQSLLEQGRFRVLDGWLKALPQEMVEGDPWLLFFAAACMFAVNPSTTKALFERAYDRFQAVGDAVGAFLSWASVVEAIIFSVEKTSEVDRWIPRHDELAERYGDALPQGLKDRVTAAMYIAMVFRASNHPDFERWEAEAWTIFHRSAAVDLKAKLLFHRVLILLEKGSFQEAEAALSESRGVLNPQKMTPLAALFHRMAFILHADFTGLHDECMDLVEDGIAFAQSTGVHILDAVMAGHAAWSCLKNRDSANARRYLAFMEKSASAVHPFSRSFCFFLKAFDALESGALQAAGEFSERNIALCRIAGYEGNILPSAVLGAHVQFELGHADRAHALLEEVRATTRRFGAMSAIYGFDLLLTMAHFAFQAKDEASGCRHLRDALELGRSRGYRRSLVWRPKVMADLCVKALEAGIEADYVKALIAKAQLTPDTAPVHLEEWPFPIKIYTLGRFAILRDGENVKTGGRSQKKPLAFLKVLISLGGRQVREESVSDLLWPEADGDAAHNAFATTLSRLRRIVGHEGAIELHDGKVTLMPNVCWVDAWAFERLVGTADTAWGEGDDERARRLAEKAFATYSGSFLSGEENEWAVSPRQKLKNKFLRNVMWLGGHLEERGMWNKALDHYLRGLEVDELVEEFYTRAMECSLKLGRNAAALSIYNRCRETLGRRLGVRPSPETEEVLRRIAMKPPELLR